MKLVWLPLAIAQREHVIEFIAEDSIDAALRFDDEIDAKCDRLNDYPFSGRGGRMPGTRELLFIQTISLFIALSMMRWKLLRSSTPPSAGRKPLPDCLASAIEGR